MSIEVCFGKDGEAVKPISFLTIEEVGVYIDNDPLGKRAFVSHELAGALGGVDVHVFDDPALVEIAESDNEIPYRYFTHDTRLTRLLPGSAYGFPIHASPELHGRMVLRHLLDSDTPVMHMAN